MSTKLVWTKVDEAPELASYALLPVVSAFTTAAGIEVETRDISLAGRIIAAFPENLNAEQKINDDLAHLGDLVKTPEANVIKLPNISASVPQLQAAIEELQQQGYKIPNFPGEPKTDEEKELKNRFAKILGSAVNPVLREGNSDRRAAAAVKKFAMEKPHGMMKDWPTDSVTRIAHMDSKDFCGSERSTTLPAATTARIEFAGANGTETLKEGLTLQEGEVLDCSVMNVAELRAFFRRCMAEAKEKNALLSLHLKATMMKVSDPIMFGHAVSVYFAEALDKHADALKSVGANVNNGIAAVLARLAELPADKRSEIEKDIEACYSSGPSLAMVDSSKGITNLHKPNDVIIDASVPVVVRDGGKMWNKDDALQDTIAMIPDRSYATIFQQCIADCQKNGQFDPATMGAVSNVGLMAQKAEEYGSHDKTFEAPGPGEIRIVDEKGTVLLSQQVDTGDIFRACQTKDRPVRDWVKLAVNRARDSGDPAIFWLDPNRGHDIEINKKVEVYLKDHDLTGLDVRVLSPNDAMDFTLARTRKGESTVSVTGNVLRDYLTDLFPILELGSSSRMLSIVPLLEGGGLFETGAGGSAPKHVEQFVNEGHLRWDSLGEYCALVPSLEMVAAAGNATAKVLATALDKAISSYLSQARAPSRRARELDNRGSTFYLTQYWADALAAQTDNADLAKVMAPVAAALKEKEKTILDELNGAQGSSVDIGGYYHADPAKASVAMRPSQTFNAIIDGLNK